MHTVLQSGGELGTMHTVVQSSFKELGVDNLCMALSPCRLSGLVAARWLRTMWWDACLKIHAVRTPGIATHGQGSWSYFGQWPIVERTHGNEGPYHWCPMHDVVWPPRSGTTLMATKGVGNPHGDCHVDHRQHNWAHRWLLWALEHASSMARGCLGTTLAKVEEPGEQLLVFDAPDLLCYGYPRYTSYTWARVTPCEALCMPSRVVTAAPHCIVHYFSTQCKVLYTCMVHARHVASLDPSFMCFYSTNID